MHPLASSSALFITAMARLEAAVRRQDGRDADASWARRLAEAPSATAPAEIAVRADDLRALLSALAETSSRDLLCRARLALEPVAFLARRLDLPSPAAAWSDEAQAIVYRRPGNDGVPQTARLDRQQIRTAREAYLALCRHARRGVEREEGRADEGGSRLVSAGQGDRHELV